ncbi:hypothetical protein RSal33209_0213 [Renibacterium salmoninarum ATCC 33209]|uniref:Uncharacterized protein n=1 Tax=Renibacterium salmoninarum (strain ATCC 33209 / DSM 20767 / JCM 11484 / NBRC 15589 / NCIMB 2235) TaxID=288705 RepID=A9WLU3_RENSM|nr:hypothetical protein RSal33209_0213 [Renibacterium salmoninarum ATCC 33209]
MTRTHGSTPSRSARRDVSCGFNDRFMTAKQERFGFLPMIAPPRQTFGTSRRNPAESAGSQSGSPLRPGWSVLIRGVSRRLGSLACVREGASAIEWHLAYSGQPRLLLSANPIGRLTDTAPGTS